MIDLAIFSERLNKLRDENKLSQEKLAEEVKIDRNTISNYCLGKTVPNLDYLYVIAKYFKVSIDYLVGHTIDIPVTVLMSNGLKRITGLNVIMKKQQVSSGDTITTLRCSRHNNVTKSKLYPRTDDNNAISNLLDFDYVVEDVYYVLNGNIYREADISDPNVDPVHKYSRIDTSVYDYVNDGNSIEPYKEAYETERFYLGAIGALSADDFYCLNYLLGYYSKVQAEASENE